MYFGPQSWKAPEPNTKVPPWIHTTTGKRIEVPGLWNKINKNKHRFKLLSTLSLSLCIFHLFYNFTLYSSLCKIFKYLRLECKRWGIDSLRFFLNQIYHLPDSKLRYFLLYSRYLTIVAVVLEAKNNIKYKNLIIILIKKNDFFALIWIIKYCLIFIIFVIKLT